VFLLLSSISDAQMATPNEARLIEVGPGSYCKWSPDGRYLSFANANGLQLYVVDSGTVRLVAAADDVAGLSPFDYEWSGPEDLIVVRSGEAKSVTAGQRQWDYLSIHIDGAIKVLYSESASLGSHLRSRPNKLNTGQVVIFRESVETPEALIRMRAAAGPSADSYFVISNASAWHTHYWGGEMDTDVWLVRPDGSPYKRVTTGKRYGLPSLSPNGLLVMCRIGAVILGLDGTIVGQFSGNVELEGWFATSERVLFSRATQSEADVVASDIYSADIDAGNEIRITDTPGKIELDATISPDMTKIAYRNYAPEGNFIEILEFGEVLK
jgi:hypothetical protein